MHLTRSGRFERSDIWREGKWIDLWSVVHLLTGVSVGVGMPVFHFSAIPTIIIVSLALALYEMWEAMVKIHETPQNRVTDVVCGMASFLPSFFLTEHLIFVQTASLFFPILAVNVSLAVMGWQASTKADEFEARLRAEFAERNARRLKRRAHVRLMRQERRERRALARRGDVYLK